MPYRLLSAREIMSTRFTVFRPEMDIDDATARLLDQGLMGAPVVDEGGHLIGVLAEKDCFRVVVHRAFGLDNGVGGTVADFMTPDVVSVDADTDLATVGDLFLRHTHRGLPVVHHGRVVGLLSRRDVLRALLAMERETQLAQYPDYVRPETDEPARG